MIAGSFIFHLLRALRRSFGRIALLFLVTGLIAAIVVELVSIYLSHGQLPTLATHLTAIALGFAVAYASSASMLVVEIIRDLYLTMEDMERDFFNEFRTATGLVDKVVQGVGGELLGQGVERTFRR